MRIHCPEDECGLQNRMSDREITRERPLQHHLCPRRTNARSLDRRHYHSNLPDIDLRAGRAGRPQGIRVRPHAEPDAFGPRSEPRCNRGREGGFLLCIGHGGDERRHDAAQVGRPRRGDRRHVRRYISTLRTGASKIPARFHLREHLASERTGAGDQAGDPSDLSRDADQPHARRHRPRFGMHDRARARYSGRRR